MGKVPAGSGLGEKTAFVSDWPAGGAGSTWGVLSLPPPTWLRGRDHTSGLRSPKMGLQQPLLVGSTGQWRAFRACWDAPGGERGRRARGDGPARDVSVPGASGEGKPPGRCRGKAPPRQGVRQGLRVAGQTDGWTDGWLPPRAPLAQPGRGRVKGTAVTPAGFFRIFSAESAGGHVLLRFRCFGGFCPAGYDPCRQQAAVPSRCHHPTAARWPQGIPGWFWGAPGGCSAPSPAGSCVAWCWQSPRFQLARGRAEPDLVSCDGEVVN